MKYEVEDFRCKTKLDDTSLASRSFYINQCRMSHGFFENQKKTYLQSKLVPEKSITLLVGLEKQTPMKGWVFCREICK